MIRPNARQPDEREKLLHQALRKANYHQHVCIVCRNANAQAASEKQAKQNKAMIVYEFPHTYLLFYIIFIIALFY